MPTALSTAPYLTRHTKPHTVKSWGLICLICCGMTLAACTGQSPRHSGPQPSQTQPTSSNTQNTIQQASSRYESGQFAASAELYLNAANTSTGRSRQSLLIRAADAARRAGRDDLSQRALSQIDDKQLSRAQRSQADLLRAEAGEYRDSPEIVLTRLPIPSRNSSAYTAKRIYVERARAQLALRQTAEAVQSMVQREAWIKDPAERQQNQEAIWTMLQTAKAIDENAIYRLDLDATTKGWIELAILDRRAWRTTNQRNVLLKDWQERNSNHPANGEILSSVASRPLNNRTNTESTSVEPGYTPPGSTADTSPTSTADIPKPTQESIALLLPLTGPFTNPARAVRDGFLAAHLGRSDAPRLIVLDITKFPDPLAAYHQARRFGATTIVGPLEKDRVSQLSSQVQGEIPILALNYLDADSPAPSGLYQFGLAPEDEAREVARRMIADGNTNAALLAPQANWALRTLRAFEKEYVQQGGQILSYKAYDPQAPDFSKTVAELLREAGHVKPKAGQPGQNTGLGLFLIAKPQQGRLIRPQFLYHGASQLPTYATSHIYSGRNDPTRDIDLDGIRFVDTDWSLNKSPAIVAVKEKVKGLYPKTFEQFSRLYAFGYDAARLQPFISDNRLEEGRYYSAASGVLFLSRDGRIGRRLSWAEFREGSARILQDTSP